MPCWVEVRVKVGIDALSLEAAREVLLQLDVGTLDSKTGVVAGLSATQRNKFQEQYARLFAIKQARKACYSLTKETVDRNTGERVLEFVR